MNRFEALDIDIDDELYIEDWDVYIEEEDELEDEFASYAGRRATSEPRKMVMPPKVNIQQQRKHSKRCNRVEDLFRLQ